MVARQLWKQPGFDPVAMDSLDAQIRNLEEASVQQLRALWRERHGVDAPRGFSKDLMARALAYQIQEEILGSLERAYERRLDEGKRSGNTAELHLKPGSVVVREYQGHVHAVTILPNGFSWQGETYPSLSTIAHKITGTSWNGPRFFGLRQRPKGKQTADPPRRGDEDSASGHRRHK
jgi:hypothetical protein